ncbi:hypothetical protein EWM62_01890 [Mucilaginibacter terrigena]|uniref:Glycoside hydrolase family 42 N-terminal domain-containing protein n=1 Tax=Mucilaginibacter terrigena TaxID=2492395 RepID=A0A4V1ZCC8_9SPHI|nr:hypothetical protein [Mucilaginibacter terrigena]RYU92210.1 hypothetical protein EWM62_01890 [Mucilaginibacter terrigena]
MDILFGQRWICTVLVAVLGFSRCGVKPVPPSVKDTVKVISPAQANTTDSNQTPLKNMFGINSYEWNFLENPAAPNNRDHIYEANMALIKSFSAVRHYLNWNKLENTQGNYTYNPTNNGSWYYDIIYSRCKQDGIMVLADIKNLPVWMMDTYPAGERDDENVPAAYGANRLLPASYIIQARTAFQFAARYGYNTHISPDMVKVDSRPRWNNDAVNTVKFGLGLIKYIECGNEPDRWWKGDKATQTPEEYAANMSAFYDGHKGTLGSNAGVKTADPSMVVVMGGLATADVKYVQRMIDWCKTNRGLKADGSINLCFDVINYHLYANDGNIFTHQRASTGVAPELTISGSVADGFVKLANGLKNKPGVWVTETGYDINQQSYQHAPPIGNKSALITQADWILRSSLMYARHGIKRLFFYQLFDATPNNPEQYSTSGLAEGTKRRPAADYILQVNKLMGNYTYTGTINADPLVDRYQSGKNTIYVLTIPDQVGRTADYTLHLDAGAKAVIYSLKPGAGAMVSSEVSPVNGELKIVATETPVFVKILEKQYNIR